MPKSEFVSNSKIHDEVLGNIIRLWWGGMTALDTRDVLTEGLRKEYWPKAEAKHPISREGISKLFNDLGQHLWQIIPLTAKIDDFTKNKGLSITDAIDRILSDQDLYYELIRTDVVPEKIKQYKDSIGQSWSVFSDRPIWHLRTWYKHSNGYSRKQFDGYAAKAIILERFIAKSDNPEDTNQIITEATYYTLEILKLYPLRKDLPRDHFPWIDLWNRKSKAWYENAG